MNIISGDGVPVVIEILIASRPQISFQRASFNVLANFRSWKLLARLLLIRLNREPYCRPPSL